MNYSKYQSTIFAFVRGEAGYSEPAGDTEVAWDAPLPEDYSVDFAGKRNAVVEAVAGSGKTTTIVKALDFLAVEDPAESAELRKVQSVFGGTTTLRAAATQPRVLFAAYNKHIAEELQKRVPRYVQASTLNSFGWGVCKANVRGVDLDKNKDENILRTTLSTDDPEQRKVFYKVKGAVSKMVGLLKALLIIDRAIIERDFTAIADKYDVEVPEVKGYPFDFRATVLDVFERSVDCVQWMSYDDQVFQPVYQGWEVPAFDWVFGDECQDWSPMQIELVRLAARQGRAVLVGDRRQCQPAGTMVDVVINKGGRHNPPVVTKVPIESLRRGQTVVSYDATNGEWRRCDEIKDVVSRPYVGDLIRVTTGDGLTSRYTPTHKCHVSFEPFRDRDCVYLMRRGNQFRVGRVAMNYGENGSGLGHRLRNERADAVWILTLCDSRVESFIEEQVISATFGLPQLTFQATNQSKCPQDEIDYAWQRIGDNTDRAIKCLESFGRDVNYPLLDARDAASGYRLKKPLVTQACNLLDGCLVLPYVHGSASIAERDQGHRAYVVRREDWIPAVVTREPYEGLVWSLSVSSNRNYVADSILTSNSIYGFRGACPDAIPRIIEAFDAIVLPLSICYRCPDAVIDEARKIVPHIEHPPDNPKGRGAVETISTPEFVAQVGDGDFALCRTTAPLVKRCLELIGLRRKASVKGRDIGQGLLALLEQLAPSPAMPIARFLETLGQYKAEQMAKLAAAGRDAEGQATEDRCETLLVLAMGCARTADIAKRVESVFSDTDSSGVTFCTGHRAKGLEAANIFILRPDLCPHPKSKKEWQREQEWNLKYVMVTRSMNRLCFVTKEKDEK